MDTFDAITSKLDVRQFDGSRNVPREVKLKILEAARVTGSGNNTQHWRFILVENKDALESLSKGSSGPWIATCNFAVMILTDPSLGYHMIDAGRATQDVQLAAWNYGVGSRLFTKLETDRIRKEFGIPQNLNPTVVVGFGYPVKKITGRKRIRKPLGEVVFLEKFGSTFDASKVK
jgi:nitroreductase